MTKKFATRSREQNENQKKSGGGLPKKPGGFALQEA
jgi:hypothetical protein